MAESTEEGGVGGGSWFGGWLQSAKEMSTSAINMVRKDLSEFGSTMQKDTSRIMEMTSATLKDSLKAENTSAAKEKVSKGLNTMLDSISKALTVPPDDTGQVPITSSTAAHMFDRRKAQLNAVQVDPATYLQEASGQPEEFRAWCTGFNLDEVKGEISELLVSKAEVRGLYAKLVPAEVSHADFWHRYFYKIHQIKLDQARKEALMKRAESSSGDDGLNWEDDWSGDEDENISDWEKLPRPGQDTAVGRTKVSVQPCEPVKKMQDEEIPQVLSSSSLASHEPSSQEIRSDITDEVEKCVSAIVSCKNSLSDMSHAASITAIEAVTSPVQESNEEAGESLVEIQQTACIVPEPDSPRSKTVCSVDHQTDAKTITAQHIEEKTPGVQCGISSQKTLTESVETVFAKGEGPVPQINIENAKSEWDESAPSVSSDITESLRQECCIQEDGSHGASRTLVMALASNINDAPAVTPIPASVPSLTHMSQALSVATEGNDSVIKTTEKGDIVVVGSEHGSPVSGSSDAKEPSMDEEWEQDLDIELTEEDFKAADELAKKLSENMQDLDIELAEEDVKAAAELAKKISEHMELEDDDWESWE